MNLVVTALQTAAPPRTLLALATRPGSCIGVDLEQGTFVFAHWPEHSTTPVTTFDVVRVDPAAEQDVPDPARPEALAVVRPPRKVGRLRSRVVDRYLRPLLLAPGQHLLGFPALTTPYWTLSGRTPSLCLVAPGAPPSVVRRDHGTGCRFLWRGVEHELPLADPWLGEHLGSTGRARLGGAALANELGYVPARLVIALTAPHDGYCSKVVAALLPRR
jgi:hypothetical protein